MAFGSNWTEEIGATVNRSVPAPQDIISAIYST
jgi:hypothetical protein